MHKLFPYVSAALILTVLFGTIYFSEQQVLRQDANDPQIQLAEDAASQLNSGASPSDVIGETKVNMQTSLAPFIIVYDNTGHVAAGSGNLQGNIPTIPFGVLAATTATHEHWITWQPEAGVRDATVTVAANHYYVISGRSLREVEPRETKVLELSAAGWAVSLAVLFVTLLLLYPFKHKRSHSVASS
jgi:hypothetical protein